MKLKLRRKGKSAAWVCSCGCIVPKRGAVLAGGPQYAQDFHVHCPLCGRVVAAFVKPSEKR